MSPASELQPHEEKEYGLDDSLIMFLDESGNHGLTTVDPDYPVFVLGGVVTSQHYAENVLTNHLQAFKTALFGDENLILHTSDIARNRNGFERMKEPAFREQVRESLNNLMRELDYKVVACAIRKGPHYDRYGLEAIDPYMLSLNVLVERFCMELKEANATGLIVAEKRSPVLDRELDVAWLNLKVQGTRYVQARTINDKIHGLNTRHKHENIAGLQLADLVVSPIGRHVIGKRAHEDWNIVESKFRRHGGTYKDAGLIILPKE